MEDEHLFAELFSAQELSFIYIEKLVKNAQISWKEVMRHKGI